MKRPPLLPAEALRKVLHMGRFNGTVLLVVAGTFALWSAGAQHDVFGTVVSLLVAGAGAMELHGATLLGHGHARGMRWMIGGQFYLMAIVLAYVGLQLRHIDVAQLRAMVPAEKQQEIVQAGFSVDEFLRLGYQMVYYSLAGATVIYQGAMAWYYQRKKKGVETALKEIIWE